MSYTIKVLSSEEFDRLPFSRAKEALGAADVTTNSVYVRNTHMHELNRYLLDHELDHLVEETPTDEFDGIRYKITDSLFSGIKSLGGSLFSGAQNVGSNIFSGAQNFGSGLLSGAQKIGSGLVGGAKNIGSGLMNMFSSGGGSSSSGNVQNYSTPGTSTNFMNPTQLKYQNLQNFGAGGQQAGGAAFQPSGGGGSSSGFKLPWQQLLGAGALGIGLLKQLPKSPPLPESVNQARTQIQSGGSPLGQFGGQKLQGLLGQNYEPLSQPEIQASLRQLEQDQLRSEDQVRDLYRNLRPGTDPSTDSAFRRDLQQVQDQFSRAKADTVATRTRDTKTAFDQQRLQQIQLAIGASEQEMNQLMELAKLDVAQIAAQLDLDFEQARIFKETFIGLGQGLISGPQTSSPLVNFNVGGV